MKGIIVIAFIAGIFVGFLSGYLAGQLYLTEKIKDIKLEKNVINKSKL